MESERGPNYPIAPEEPSLEDKRKRDRMVLEKFNIYQRAEADHKGGGKYLIMEIKEFIAGKGDQKNREQFYPGWTKKDFEELLRLIEDLGD